MFRRIGLFLLTNILIVATITIITSALGLNRYMSASGLNYPALLGFCLVWGFVGAFIFGKKSAEVFGGRKNKKYNPIQNLENEINNILSKIY